MAGSGSNPKPEKDPLSTSLSPNEEVATYRHRILIVIVEDNASDVLLIRHAIDGAKLEAELHVVRDGEEAIRFFDEADNNREAPCPSLVVLDINLPRKQGGDVLAHLRNSHRCSNALVIAMSTSDSARDRENMANLGADRYFCKPSEYDDFMKLGDMIKELLGKR
jgi:two-component system, chemotaxis family, response regulator Rcp1